MADDPRALGRRFISEVIDTRDTSRIGEFFAEDFVEHDPFPGQKPGLAGFKEGFDMFIAAFPDYESEVLFDVAEGDKIVHVVRTRGTHTGEMMGIPPTGKRIDITEIHVGRVANGKMVEHWGVVDTAAMMQQLGLSGGDQPA